VKSIGIIINSMKKLLMANWKMNPKTEKEAIRLAKASDAANVVVYPPFPFLPAVAKALKKATLGAQDLFWEAETGPYTGEVSARELKSVGVEYVIIGHSSRRALGEKDEVIAKKVQAALSVGLVPILCVGEVLEEREAGRAQEVVDKQLRTVLSQLPLVAHGQLFVAYEPVWAISTTPHSSGLQSLSAEEAPAKSVELIRYMQHMVSTIQMETKFLYGGSVNLKNVQEVFGYDEIDGALVGGASLKAAEFGKMIKEVST